LVRCDAGLDGCLGITLEATAGAIKSYRLHGSGFLVGAAVMHSNVLRGGALPAQPPGIAVCDSLRCSCTGAGAVVSASLYTTGVYS
jgi:hypothetical protein